MTDTVLPWTCNAPYDTMPTSTICGRARNHGDQHRGTTPDGRLVSWPPLEHVEVGERWDDNPDGWLSYGGTLVGGPWALVAAVTPYAVLAGLVAAACLAPALVLLAWRAAL